MAHHQSAKKRIRQDAVKRLRNRYYGKTTRNAIRKFRSTEEKGEAVKMLPGLVAMIDKLAKRNIIHRNKAGNLKSSLDKQVARLA
ncbi:MAG: small subunit ribosomal protein S20 [Limisphaerales bacterium]|jgi:small subunit ribosomal protein S20